VKVDYRCILTTKVGNGVQQAYFDAALEEAPVVSEQENDLNRYLTNLGVIRDTLAEEEAFGSPEQVIAFAKYLLTRVYFVVIETKAGLSKTLQIFNAINTAGMDLNGGDLFKIRFYEYLRNRGDAETVFDQVSALYDKIDHFNRDAKKAVVSMEEVLNVARQYVATEAGLAASTRFFAGTTFFDRFFDTVFKMARWEGFKLERCQAFNLRVALIDALIGTLGSWQALASQLSAESRAMEQFIWLGRYGRYHDVLHLYRLRFAPTQDQLESFIIAFSKFLCIQSLRWRKMTNAGILSVDAIMERFSTELEGETTETVLTHLNTARYQLWNEVVRVLTTETLADAPRAKNLVCRLIAMLDEIEHAEHSQQSLCGLLFWEKDIDIEHIESFNHKDGQSRIEIQERWGANLHSLGNLTVLERSINREILNSDYTMVKRARYLGEDSKFVTVRQFAESYLTWDLQQAIERKGILAKRLADYLCGPATGPKAPLSPTSQA